LAACHLRGVALVGRDRPEVPPAVAMLTKTIFLPSGDHLGCPSNAMPRVSGVAVPPVIGIVYRSPNKSNTSVCPSGDTSTDIHCPTFVVNVSLRPGRRGRPSCIGSRAAT